MFHTKCCKPASISVEKYECNCQKFEGFARSLNKVSEKHDVNIFCIKLRFAFAATYSRLQKKRWLYVRMFVQIQIELKWKCMFSLAAASTFVKVSNEGFLSAFSLTFWLLWFDEPFVGMTVWWRLSWPNSDSLWKLNLWFNCSR